MSFWRREPEPVEVERMVDVDGALEGHELEPSGNGGTHEDAPVQRRPSLSALLTQAGVVDERQVREALDEGTRTGEKLGEVVVRRGWATEEQLARLLAEQWGLPAVAPGALSLDPLAVARLEAGQATELGGFPVWFDRRGVVVAVAEPSEERFAAFRELLGDVSFVVVQRSTLDELLESRLFGGDGREGRALAMRINGYTDAAGDEPQEQPEPPEQHEPPVGADDRGFGDAHQFEVEAGAGSLADRLRTIEADVHAVERALAEERGRAEALQAEVDALHEERERSHDLVRDLERRLGDRDERVHALREKVAELGAMLDD